MCSLSQPPGPGGALDLRLAGAPPPRRGRSPILVAAFGCEATDRLGRELGEPVAVIAATADPDAHARRLSAIRHAAYSPREGWFQPFDDGLAIPADLEYGHRPFDGRWLGERTLPGAVVLEGGCLRVHVPAGFSSADFGPLLAIAMAERAYAACASRPASVRRRFLTGRPLNLSPRYSLARPGAFGRVRLAGDLYVFRPRDLASVASCAAMAANGLALQALVSGGGERQ